MIQCIGEGCFNILPGNVSAYILAKTWTRANYLKETDEYDFILEKAVDQDVNQHKISAHVGGYMTNHQDAPVASALSWVLTDYVLPSFSSNNCFCSEMDKIPYDDLIGISLAAKRTDLIKMAANFCNNSYAQV